MQTYSDPLGIEEVFCEVEKEPKTIHLAIYMNHSQL